MTVLLAAAGHASQFCQASEITDQVRETSKKTVIPRYTTRHACGDRRHSRTTRGAAGVLDFANKGRF